MKLIFYKQAGEPNRIDKSRYLKEFGEMDNVVMTEDSDMITPSFVLNTRELVYQSNYVYCDFTKRYYFIDNIIAMTGGRIKINCSCDVLYTYKNEILSSKAWIRSGNLDYDDDSKYLHNDFPYRTDYIIKGRSASGGNNPFGEMTTTTRNILLIVK